MYSALYWYEMIMYISGLCYLPILEVCNLNISSMWELYLFEDIILTSFLQFVYSITFVSLDQKIVISVRQYY